MARAAGPGADERGRPGPDRPRDTVPNGLYLYGITRSRTWRVGGENDSLVKVRYRDLEAIVRAVPYRIADLDGDSLADHQRQVETAMRRGTILPAPYGLVFRGRRAMIRFMEDQYIALDEGLAFLDGHWELRLHVAAADLDSEEGGEEFRDLALHVYSELRRFARAAIPLEALDDRLLSAAFLVERAAWIEFVERTDDMGVAHPELTFDVTGPWPPYDFVRMT